MITTNGEFKIVNGSKVVGQTIGEIEREYNIKVKAHQPYLPCVHLKVSPNEHLHKNWYVQVEGFYGNVFRFTKDATKVIKEEDMFEEGNWEEIAKKGYDIFLGLNMTTAIHLLKLAIPKDFSVIEKDRGYWLRVPPKTNKLLELEKKIEALYGKYDKPERHSSTRQNCLACIVQSDLKELLDYLKKDTK